jgi:hypothetical protein
MQRSDFEGKIRRGRYIGAGTHVPQGDSLIPASYNTAGVVTYLPTDIYNGLIVRNPNGGARSDVLPSAAAMVAATPGVQVGDIIFCQLINGSGAAADAENITITAGAGVSFDANQLSAGRVVRTGCSKTLYFRFTNVTLGSEAVTLYC